MRGIDISSNELQTSLYERLWRSERKGEKDMLNYMTVKKK